MAEQEQKGGSPATLGDVLYAGKSSVSTPEKEWVDLVHSIAAGDKSALHALYARTHRIVFTLMVRILGSRETAEELTLDVYMDTWRRASEYDLTVGPVLAWIMNMARTRAINRLHVEHREHVRAALTSLEPQERQA